MSACTGLLYVGDGDGGRIRVACGRCLSCRSARAKSWSLRCWHEAKCWQHNWFLTLTYDDAHLPEFGSLRKEDYQRFLKRLRKRFSGHCSSPLGDSPIRYYGCGEYGSTTSRPHYHLLLFNLQLLDARQRSRGVFTSGSLSELWRFGNHVLAPVTPASASYVAGYETDKLRRAVGESRRPIVVVDEATGELLSEREPEFKTMSNRPGIGSYWYRRYGFGDLRHGYAVGPGGVKGPIPRFYEDKRELDDPALVEEQAFQRAVFQASLGLDTDLQRASRHADLVARLRNRRSKPL